MSSKTVFPGKADGIINAPNSSSGDDSLLGYFLAAGLISGHVGITGVPDDITSPHQGIVALMEEKRMGIDVRNGAVFARKSHISNFDVDAKTYAAELPALAAMFCVGNGKCVITDAFGTDYIQGDRMERLVTALCAIGADIRIDRRNIVIEGKRRLFGGAVSASGDGHIAMALSLAALRCETPVRIDDVDMDVCPDFFDKLSALGVLIQ